jgi:ATP phosphoribosyltransferase regulatory subunit HisZ
MRGCCEGRAGRRAAGRAKLHEVVQALSQKDAPALAELTAGCPGGTRDGAARPAGLYGGAEVLERRAGPAAARADREALDDLAWLASHLRRPPGRCRSASTCPT